MKRSRIKPSQPLRVDFEDGVASFVTRRVRNSQLVYAHPAIQERVLGSLGKYVHKFQVTVYAFCFFGSHDHGLFDFETGTKSDFFRDFGSRTAEAVKKYIPDFGGGSVLEKRTSEQAVPQDAEGYLNQMMYILLQPVAAGLCKRTSEYPGFSCLRNLITGEPLEVEFLNYEKYNKARSRKKNVDRSKYVEKYTINFARLPGCENMSQKEYGAFIMRKYNERRRELLDEFAKAGYVWPSLKVVQRTMPTDCAKNPKKSERGVAQPLVICKCPERRQQYLAWYYAIVELYKRASTKYLAGDRDAEFPPGTNKPPGPFVYPS